MRNNYDELKNVHYSGPWILHPLFTLKNFTNTADYFQSYQKKTFPDELPKFQQRDTIRTFQEPNQVHQQVFSLKN